jgi:MHS family proline/betaine transporter-like MFS transporter
MLLKNKILSSFGSSLEWFDFALYGFFAPIFSQIFFATPENHWITLMAAYGVFAIGFLARPIGALVFGYLGDKYGRIISLRITPVLITIATVLIACLPTYKSVGNLSIVLLITVRIIQGILLGGEYAGNIVYLCESSHKWRYLWGSVGSCAGSLGIIIASAVATVFYSVFTDTFMHNYGWRIAFLFSIPLGVLTFYIRLKIPESPDFQFRNNTNPLAEAITEYKVNILIGLGLICLHATSFYFTFMFLPVYLSKVRHLTESAALLHNTAFLLIHLLAIPVFGMIVNFVGGKKSIITIAALFSLLSLPIFYGLSHGTGTVIAFCLLILSIMTAVNAAIIPGLLAEMTPSFVRYTVLGLVFNVGFGVFGGLTPLVVLWLITKSYGTISPGLYLTAAALVTLTVAITTNLRERKGSRRETG